MITAFWLIVICCTVLVAWIWWLFGWLRYPNNAYWIRLQLDAVLVGATIGAIIASVIVFCMMILKLLQTGSLDL